MAEIENTTDERKSRYGDWSDHAEVADELIMVLEKRPELWNKLPVWVRHTMRYILDKIARAFTGDPLYRDNPHDIQGYAFLWEERISRVEEGKVREVRQASGRSNRQQFVVQRPSNARSSSGAVEAFFTIEDGKLTAWDSPRIGAVPVQWRLGDRGQIQLFNARTGFYYDLD
jgi:hypothetical protein